MQLPGERCDDSSTGKANGKDSEMVLEIALPRNLTSTVTELIRI